MYFLITCGEDGHCMQSLTKCELETAIEDCDYDFGPYGFDDLARQQYGEPERAILIDGRVIQPEPIEKVKTWRIPYP